MPSEKRLSWLKWYPADWRADPRLRMCSLAARGLWIELIGYMHESPRYGYLLIGDRPPTVKQIATLVGEQVKAVERAMDELETSGVFSVEDGIIYSRRMVRDKAKADADRENGRSGGNPKLIEGDNGGVNPHSNPEDKAARGHAPATQKLEARSQKEEPTLEGSEPEPRSLRSPAGYAFEGTIVRLSQRDFDAWKTSFFSYPDLRAELETIDARLVEQNHEGPWFSKVSGWLKRGHERNLATRALETDDDPDAEAALWRALLREFVETRAKTGRGYWPSNRGVPPGRSGCQVPPELLSEFGLSNAEIVAA